MIPRYTFELNNGVTNVQRTVHPVFKDDLSLDFAYENGQMFRRSQLSGQLVFLGDDYDYIVGTPFENTITFKMFVSYIQGGTPQLFWQGVFHLTDCTINVDDKKVKVRPQISDRYSKILAGLDKEFDLIKLTPAIQPVTVIRRPMIQIYVPGDSIVSCLLSGMQWEQDANSETSESALRDTYHFGKINDFVDWHFSGTYPVGMGGAWIGTWPVSNSNGEWRCLGNGLGVYFITYFQSYIINNDVFQATNGVRVYAESNPTTVLWEYKQTTYHTGYLEFDDIPDDVTLSPKNGSSGSLTASWVGTAVYGRVCLAAKGQNDYDIPNGDIVANNRNYKYCRPFGVTDVVVMTYNSSSNPTEWGIRPDGDYYVKPDLNVDTIDYFPVARSSWNYASIWFRQTTYTEAVEVQGRVETELKDAFTLEACIKALLSEIDSTILFEGSQVYSRFLFGQNPLMNNYWGRLVLTPKSNVLVAEYTQPARKAPITLGQIFDMLAKVCGCYWYINDGNQLIIEHISYFKNGGSYSGTQAIGIDITVADNTRSGKSIDFGTNEYYYDKMDMPERYQYEWMDDTTNIFKGEPIDVVSSFVSEGKIEEISVSGFNSDLDYMMLNPSNVSEDGFALLCCTVTNGEYKTTIESPTLQPNNIQNWQLSFFVLQAAFLISDMPSWNIKVNGSATTAKGIQRGKKQKVDIPLGYIEPNLSMLVRTGIGVGEIQAMNIRLTSKMAKTTIAYDTTQQ